MKPLILLALTCINVASCTAAAQSPATSAAPAAAADEAAEGEIIQNLYIIGLLVFICFYFFVESLFEKHKPPVGHTTGVIISLGVFFSWIIFVIYEHDEKDKDTAAGGLIDYIQFRPTIFFDVVLPLIVFPSGFNMRRKKFF